MGNPAARLHAILARAASVVQGERMVNGWKHGLQLPQDMDDLGVMSKVGRVFTPPDVIAKEIERFKDIDTEPYLGWRKNAPRSLQKLFGIRSPR